MSFISAFDTNISFFLIQIVDILLLIQANYVHYGCLENRTTRILRGKAAYLKPNSPWHCQKFCEGYIYFGVEVGSCYKLVLRLNVNISLSVIVSHVNASRMFEVSM